MAEPFISEIRIMSFGFAPKGWALCNGQLLPINQNQALFSLLGTTYGGDGRVTFGLPDLQARTPLHMASGHALGEKAGEQSHTLAIAELPQHHHVVNANSDLATTHAPSPAVTLAASQEDNIYCPPSPGLTMAANAISPVGGSQAHENMQPYLTLNFCIALQGIYPSRN